MSPCETGCWGAAKEGEGFILGIMSYLRPLAVEKAAAGVGKLTQKHRNVTGTTKLYVIIGIRGGHFICAKKFERFFFLKNPQT